MLFLVLGTFPAFLKSMPRSGGWMEDVKIFLGLLLIGVAVYYYLGLVLPVVAYWVVAVAASLVGAVYIAVRSGKEGVAPGLRWFWRLSGAALVVFAVYAGVAKVPPAIAGGAHEGTGAIAVAPEGDGIPVASAPDSQAGAVETSAPVEHVAAPESPTAGEDEEWLADEAEALAIAKREKRPVVVDFGAAWCAACKELEKITFAEERVKEAMKNFVKVRIDCTEETEGNAALRQKYGALALPTVAFIGANGELQSEITLRKFEGPDKFLERLKKVPQ
jgi:thiol:disulfide interchange protein DsbD